MKPDGKVNWPVALTLASVGVLVALGAESMMDEGSISKAQRERRRRHRQRRGSGDKSRVGMRSPGGWNREWGPLDFEEAHDKADRLRGKFFTVAFQVDERPDGFYVIELDVN
jgi:hypothetical protein